MVYGSPGSESLQKAVQGVQTPAPASPARPVYSRPVSAPPVSAPPVSAPPASKFEVVVKREEDPSESVPLSYREFAYAIDEGSTEAEAEAFIHERFKEHQERLASSRPGKLINLAVFDHAFQGKPKRPPLVTLIWKDWKGGEPEVRFPSRPGASIPAPSLSPPPRMPSTPAPKSSASPSAAAPPAPSVPAPPAAPSAPVPVRSEPPTQQAAKSFPAPAGQPAAKVPDLTTPASTPAARRRDSSKKIELPSQPTMRSAEPAPDAPLNATVKLGSQPPQAAVMRPGSKPTPFPGADELIVDIFESVHDLHFLRDMYEGADFVVALAVDKLRSQLGIAQLYDINRREFVVTRAVGPGAEKAVGTRTPERDPLLLEIMSRRTPFVIDAMKDPRVKTPRWEKLGGDPKWVLVCSVAQGGRFLGILEVALSVEGKTYSKGHHDALAYISQSFAEFVAGRGLLFGDADDLLPH